MVNFQGSFYTTSFQSVFERNYQCKHFALSSLYLCACVYHFCFASFLESNKLVYSCNNRLCIIYIFNFSSEIFTHSLDRSSFSATVFIWRSYFYFFFIWTSSRAHSISGFGFIYLCSLWFFKMLTNRVFITRLIFTFKMVSYALFGVF